jgi:putative membrane protein
MRLLARLAVPFIAILIGARLFEQWFAVPDLATVAIFSLVLSLLNAVVKPVIEFFSVPITCLTLGLFHIIINAIVFALAAWLVPGVVIGGFTAAIVGAILVSAIGILMSWLTRPEDK